VLLWSVKLNIFVLSKDPVRAAIMQCDQHVVKMTLETAQLLCSSFEIGLAPYKRTHFNHPCSKWARESEGNFLWLCKHGIALAEEYAYRYNKNHKSEAVIIWCWNNIYKIPFPKKRRSAFAMAMPEEFIGDCAVESYRRFYKNSKLGFARWEKGRPEPVWLRKKRYDYSRPD